MALPNNKIRIITPPDGISYDIVPSLLQDGTTSYSLSVPTLGADDTIVTLGTTQTITGEKHFKNSNIIEDPTETSTRLWLVSGTQYGTIDLKTSNNGGINWANRYSIQTGSFCPTVANTVDLGNNNANQKWRNIYMSGSIKWPQNSGQNETLSLTKNTIGGSASTGADYNLLQIYSSDDGANIKTGIQLNNNYVITSTDVSDFSAYRYFNLPIKNAGTYTLATTDCVSANPATTSSTLNSITINGIDYAIVSSAPANMVTTNTSQTISGQKTFSGSVILTNEPLRINSDNHQTHTGDDWDSYIKADKIEIENQDTGNIGELLFPDIEDRTETIATLSDVPKKTYTHQFRIKQAYDNGEPIIYFRSTDSTAPTTYQNLWEKLRTKAISIWVLPTSLAYSSRNVVVTTNTIYWWDNNNTRYSQSISSATNFNKWEDIITED